MLQKVLPGSTHRENPVPQACILLKIQNIHYGFTWKNKVEALKWNLNLSFEPVQSLVCLIIHIPSQSSFLCKGTQASINARGHIPERCKKIKRQRVLYVSRTERILTSSCMSNSRGREWRASFKHWLPEAIETEVMASKRQTLLLIQWHSSNNKVSLMDL